MLDLAQEGGCSYGVDLIRKPEDLLALRTMGSLLIFDLSFDTVGNYYKPS